MKTKTTLFLMALLVWSCGDETLAPTTPLDDKIDENATLIYSGTFTNGPYGNVMGKAQIFENVDKTFELKLESFNTSNGPDLYVYLSKEAMPINFISLGKLKSTNGNQVYSISGMPEFNEYKFVTIHCQEYNHLFGYAELAE